jgi:hypothetical protein
MADPDCSSAPSNPRGNALVLYGSSAVGGSGSIVTPFVSKDVEYVRGQRKEGNGGDRWIEKETWTLQGQLINCEGYEKLLEAQADLRRIFFNDFQDLEVGNLDVLHFGRVVSIDFGDAPYLDNTPYTVVIEGYRNIEDISEDARVINPSATYTWAENDDGTMNLTYKVSAEGVTTSSTGGDALDNAKKFVQDYLSNDNHMFENQAKGFGPYIAYMGENPGSKRFLVSTEESIDRVSGTYGISRVYKMDQGEAEYSVLRYTSSVDEKYGENLRTTFEGSIDVGYNANADLPQGRMAHLRDRYYDFKKALVHPNSEDAVEASDYLSERVEEDDLAGLLTFTIVVGEAEDGCVDDFDVAVNESAESSLVSVRVNGTITHLGPCDFDSVKQCFYGSEYGKDCDKRPEYAREKYYYDVAVSGYRQFKDDHSVEIGNRIPDDVVLNANPLDLSITEDPYNKKISYSMTFDDRLSWGAHKFDYTMSINPPVQQVSVNSFQEICPATDGASDERVGPDCTTASDPARSHHYQDLGFAKRGTFGFKATVEGSANLLPSKPIFTFAEDLMAKNIGESNPEWFLTKNRIGQNEEEDACDDACGDTCVFGTYEYEWLWKSESDGVVNPDPDDRTDVQKLYFGVE